jgi:hypothetical protein
MVAGVPLPLALPGVPTRGKRPGDGTCWTRRMILGTAEGWILRFRPMARVLSCPSRCSRRRYRIWGGGSPVSPGRLPFWCRGLPEGKGSDRAPGGGDIETVVPTCRESAARQCGMWEVES